MKILISLLFLMSFSGFAAEKKEKNNLKKDINETADQIDKGTRKVIKGVKTLIEPKEKKK